MLICGNYTYDQLQAILGRSIYIIDFDGVIVHRFTQVMDFLGARKDLAKAMIENGFEIDIIKRFTDPYELLKLCYGDWGIHKKFELFSKILERYELHAIPKVVADLYANELLQFLIDKGKTIYISSLQSTLVINQILRRIGIPTNLIKVCGRDVGGRPKPYPDQLRSLNGGNAVVIGDSLTDGYLAKNINSYFIGLDTDGYTLYELCDVGAAAIFNSLEELLTYIPR